MNVIAAHQVEIADRLCAFDYFGDIHVFAERQGDLAGKLDEALAGRVPKNGRIGVAVMVGVVRGDVNNPNVPGPWFDRATVDVTVLEAVLLNTSQTGTGKACIDVAVMVGRVMHQYYPQGVGGEITVGKEAVRPLGEVRPGIIAYKVTLQINPECDVLQKVQRPTISIAAGAVPQTVTLGCETVLADIYYTKDGSYPWSGNPGAVRYDGQPVTIFAPCDLRVVAHLVGWSASDAALGSYT